MLLEARAKKGTRACACAEKRKQIIMKNQELGKQVYIPKIKELVPYANMRAARARMISHAFRPVRRIESMPNSW